MGDFFFVFGIELTAEGGEELPIPVGLFLF